MVCDRLPADCVKAIKRQISGPVRREGPPAAPTPAQLRWIARSGTAALESASFTVTSSRDDQALRPIRPPYSNREPSSIFRNDLALRPMRPPYSSSFCWICSVSSVLMVHIYQTRSLKTILKGALRAHLAVTRLTVYVIYIFRLEFCTRRWTMPPCGAQSSSIHV